MELLQFTPQTWSSTKNIFTHHPENSVTTCKLPGIYHSHYRRLEHISDTGRPVAGATSSPC